MALKTSAAFCRGEATLETLGNAIRDCFGRTVIVMLQCVNLLDGFAWNDFAPDTLRINPGRVVATYPIKYVLGLGRYDPQRKLMFRCTLW